MRLLADEVEACLSWCFFPLTLQTFFQPLWFLFPWGSSAGSVCTAVDRQHSCWEQEQPGGYRYLLCPGAPSEHSSVLPSTLFAKLLLSWKPELRKASQLRQDVPWELGQLQVCTCCWSSGLPSDEQWITTLHHHHPHYRNFKWMFLSSDKGYVCLGRVWGSEAMPCDIIINL